MARIKTIKTNFTAGEISPELIGRGDLSAYNNGARRLRNVRIFPTGGVTRRPGLRHVTAAAGSGRLVAFEFNTEQVYLLLFTDGQLDIFADDELRATLTTPWDAEKLSTLAWTQSADTLLLVQPDVPPKKLVRKGASNWDIHDWKFHEADGRLFQPTYKFADEEVTLAASATTGTVTLTASDDVFVDDHAGVRFRLQDKEVEITAVSSPTSATAEVKETLVGTAANKDWEEAAFSPVRGYPVSCCFHQDRLVIGGSRDLTNRLWLSKSADLFNFDLGEAEDDEAIEFAILSDQVNAIRAVFSGRHLQVFTSGAEWMVTGDPLTPSAIQLKRQTRIGSRIDRTVLPRDVDGATLFVSRSGTELREFLFTDVEQAYQSNDLAVLTERMLRDPIDQDFNKADRLMHIVNGDGTLATVTSFRQEKVTAWSLLETEGAFKSVAVVGETVYVLVERAGSHRIERFDHAVLTDAAVTDAVADDAEPKSVWSGFEHLDGLTVDVVADGIVRQQTTIADGLLTLDQPARKIQAGLPYRHIIEPLPVYQPGGSGISQGTAVRLVKATFRLLETAALTVDTGQGLKPLPFKNLGPGALDSPIARLTGDKTVRALGWTRGEPIPLWRVEQSDPLPCTILAVLTELSSNG
jgi:hypothetical protein